MFHNRFLFEGILTVVDVYSEWAGPCNAMANYLKKIKLEVGDDLLQCAMAKYSHNLTLIILRSWSLQVRHYRCSPDVSRPLQAYLALHHSRADCPGYARV